MLLIILLFDLREFEGEGDGSLRFFTHSIASIETLECSMLGPIRNKRQWKSHVKTLCLPERGIEFLVALYMGPTT